LAARENSWWRSTSLVRPGWRRPNGSASDDSGGSSGRLGDLKRLWIPRGWCCSGALLAGVVYFIRRRPTRVDAGRSYWLRLSTRIVNVCRSAVLMADPTALGGAAWDRMARKIRAVRL
jgi:hypothetical protein